MPPPSSDTEHEPRERTEMSYVIDPPTAATLPVRGSDALFPVHRIYCVGRNYAAHAIEMGHDPDKEPPFFFQKNPDNLLVAADFPYPSMSSDVHTEIEMGVALQSERGRASCRERVCQYV